MPDLATVHARLDAIGNEHEAGEDSLLGTGATAVAECLGVDPHELARDALERIMPALEVYIEGGSDVLPSVVGGLLKAAYIDAFLTGAAWGRDRS